MSTERSTGYKCFGVSVILLLTYCKHVKGVVEISPSGVAPVCQAGDQLELRCSVPGAFLRWESNVPGAQVRFLITVPADGSSGVPPPIMVNSTRFTFSRLSTQPLTSAMVINNVSEGLNGVQMNCEDVETSESAMTTIRIVDVRATTGVNLSIQSPSEQFTSDSVIVLLEWTVSLSPIYYQQLLQNVSILVVPDIGVTIANTSVQLTLQYNREYSVSVTQPGLCGQPDQTEVIQLRYSKCSNPMVLTQNNVQVMGYEDPALEGESVMFTCESGLELIGSSSSTCMGNGEWEPAPGEVNCTESRSDAETTTSNAATMPVCMSNGTSTCPGSSPSNTIKLALGIVFGVLAAVLVIIVVVLLALFLKHKGFPKHRTRKLDNSSGYILDTRLSIEREALSDPNNHKVEETLVYADIGPASFPKQQRALKTTLLDLDDSHVEYAQLDHAVHKDKVSTLKVSTTESDNNCPPVNLDSLLIQLRPQVGTKWHQFGEAAGISKDALDKIAEQCPPDECIVELFDHWLRNATDLPSWKTIADILKAIKLTELARDIEKVYVTGTLPIEVDMNQIPQLVQEEEELPPPLPERSVDNMYTDTPRVNNEVSAPALPPKPTHMKSANTVKRD